jgi:ADP-ribose pyrophosphatase YjhB (NUDIX family)
MITTNALAVKVMIGVQTIVFDDKDRLLVVPNSSTDEDGVQYQMPTGWLQQGESVYDAARRILVEQTAVVMFAPGDLPEGEESYAVVGVVDYTADENAESPYLMVSLLVQHVRTCNVHKSKTNASWLHAWEDMGMLAEPQLEAAYEAFGYDVKFAVPCCG